MNICSAWTRPSGAIITCLTRTAQTSFPVTTDQPFCRLRQKINREPRRMGTGSSRIVRWMENTGLPQRAKPTARISGRSCHTISLFLAPPAFFAGWPGLVSCLRFGESLPLLRFSATAISPCVSTPGERMRLGSLDTPSIKWRNGWNG